MIKKAIFGALLASAIAATPAAAEPDYAASVKADYDKSLATLWDHFHRNPELSFREYKTGARMAEELRAVPGMVVTDKVGGTGVVGMLKNGDGPVVLIRADMDGLPVQERSGLANSSTVRQVGVDGAQQCRLGRQVGVEQHILADLVGVTAVDQPAHSVIRS
jgi:hippurate hydrolase